LKDLKFFSRSTSWKYSWEN